MAQAQRRPFDPVKARIGLKKAGAGFAVDWIVPPLLDHSKYLEGEVESFNGDHPFGRTAFVMMKFPDRPEERVKDNVLNNIFKGLKARLREYGIEAVRADEKNYSSRNQLWDNVCVYMLGCKYGIAILESKYRKEFNPNVALEYGFMLALGSQVILLEEEGFKHRRADIIGTLSKSFKWSSKKAKLDASIRAAVDKWMRDLGKTKTS